MKLWGKIRAWWTMRAWRGYAIGKLGGDSFAIYLVDRTLVLLREAEADTATKVAILIDLINDRRDAEDRQRVDDHINSLGRR